MRDLAAHLRNSYAGNSDAVTITIDVEEITLDMDVLVPCGLIINELMTNALKYAFPNGRAGAIHVQMRRLPSSDLQLTVSDDGIGLPAAVDLSSPRSLGLRIVNSLVAQLHGTLSSGEGTGAADGAGPGAAAGAGPGASFTVTFPRK